MNTLAKAFGVMALTQIPLPVIALDISDDKYQIPKNKAEATECRTLALATQPGRVTNLDIHKEPQGFQYYFAIKAGDGSTWELTCDGPGRKIIRSLEIEPK